MNSASNFPLLILRIVTGIIFVTHGAARFYHWSVPGFGDFLTSSGVPLGHWVAWVITISELVCGLLLAAGHFVRFCTAFHFLVVAGGIWLVHLPKGWFVVGHGTGGVEYSLLLLAVLAVLFVDSKS